MSLTPAIHPCRLSLRKCEYYTSNATVAFQLRAVNNTPLIATLFFCAAECVALALPARPSKARCSSHCLPYIQSSINTQPPHHHNTLLDRPGASVEQLTLLVPGNPLSNRSSTFGGKSPCYVPSAENWPAQRLAVTPRSRKSGKHLSNYSLPLPLEGVVCAALLIRCIECIRALTASLLPTVPYTASSMLLTHTRRATTTPLLLVCVHDGGA